MKFCEVLGRDAVTSQGSILSTEAIPGVVDGTALWWKWTCGLVWSVCLGCLTCLTSATVMRSWAMMKESREARRLRRRRGGSMRAKKQWSRVRWRNPLAATSNSTRRGVWRCPREGEKHMEGLVRLSQREWKLSHFITLFDLYLCTIGSKPQADGKVKKRKRALKSSDLQE